MSKDIKIMELIPINHEYADTENSVLVHFARLRNLNIEGKSVNEIMYVVFNEEKDSKVIELLKGALKIISDIKPKEAVFSLSYPEIIRNVRSLRQTLEERYSGWVIFLNLTSLRFHLHSDHSLTKMNDLQKSKRQHLHLRLLRFLRPLYQILYLLIFHHGM